MEVLIKYCINSFLKLTNSFDRKLINFLQNYTTSYYRTIHSQAQYKLYNTKIYAQKNYTMQITCRHACDHITYVHNKYFNWFALNIIQHFNTRARVLKRTRDVILSSNIIFNSLQLQGLRRILRACLVYWIR